MRKMKPTIFGEKVEALDVCKKARALFIEKKSELHFYKTGKVIQSRNNSLKFFGDYLISIVSVYGNQKCTALKDDRS